MSQFIIVIYLLFLTVFIIREYFRRMKYANIFLKTVIVTNLICLAVFPCLRISLNEFYKT